MQVNIPERSRPHGHRKFIHSFLVLVPFALVSSAGVVRSEQPSLSTVPFVLRQADADIQQIIERLPGQRTFDNTVAALDDVTTHLQNTSGVAILLGNVAPDAEIRDRSRRTQRNVAMWQLQMAQRHELYRAVKQIVDTDYQLDGEAVRLLERQLTDFRRAGATLSVTQRRQLRRLRSELHHLQTEYRRNITENVVCLMMDPDELDGAPGSWLDRLPRQGKYVRLCPNHSAYTVVVSHCHNDVTRRRVYVAFHRRGGSPNVQILEEILSLRNKIALQIGYSHAADYYTALQMAGNARQVRLFYDQLKPLVRARARLDATRLTAAKRRHTGRADATLHPWDVSYYVKRLRELEYGVDGARVQKFFPVDQVLDGLFQVTEHMFGIRYGVMIGRNHDQRVLLWHPDVHLYEITDRDSGQPLGELFLDLYARSGKYEHAAKFTIRKRKRWRDGSLQTPQVVLVCNFAAPAPGRSSLLRHDEVVTLFHEFGHGLHELLTCAEFSRLAGTSLARDFVEAPAQMFENWAWDPDVLKRCSRQDVTGKPLPDNLLHGIVQSRQLGIGLHVERQIFYGSMDLAFHSSPDGQIDTTAVARRESSETMLIPIPADTLPQASFLHLTSYPAAYYGYLWSQVHAHDMFQHFCATSPPVAVAGSQLRHAILARGGTVDELEMLRGYLGREPSIEAFLDYLGVPSHLISHSAHKVNSWLAPDRELDRSVTSPQEK